MDHTPCLAPLFWEGCHSTDAVGQGPSRPWQWLYPAAMVVACPQRWGCFFDCSQAGRFAAVSQIPSLLEPFLGILDRADNTPGCNPIAHQVLLQLWALHPLVPCIQAGEAPPKLLILLAVSIHPRASQYQ